MPAVIARSAATKQSQAIWNSKRACCHCETAESGRGNLNPDYGKGMKNYWVYIMTNKTRTVLYTGVTNNLGKRVWNHKNKSGSAFTKRYNVNSLVFYEVFEKIYDAIAAEKRIKAGSRANKIKLIESKNPDWYDLYELANV